MALWIILVKWPAPVGPTLPHPLPGAGANVSSLLYHRYSVGYGQTLHSGTRIDVDFFMKDNGEKLVLSDATIHKVDGKARYNWKEKDGYWVRVPVEN